MKKFTYIHAKTVDEAVSALGSANAWAIAGGTDLVCTLKRNILPDYPAVVVDLKTISPSLDYIREEVGVLKIGALTRLQDIAVNPIINKRYRIQLINY